MKKIILFILLLFPIFTFAKEKVIFNKCVDGDTFKIEYKGEIKSVRMLAIDTPESVKPKQEEPYGKEASKFTCKRLADAKKIEIEFDPKSDKFDKYDRLLAWVYVDDYLLQDEIIKNGYAEVAYLYGDYKYNDLLKDHEQVAKAQKVGMWSEEVEDNSGSLIYIILLLILMVLFPNLFKKSRNKIKNKAKKELKDKIDEIL